MAIATPIYDQPVRATPEIPAPKRPPPVRSRSRTRKGPAGVSPTAAAIREAATLLFAERGYEMTTMKAIAEWVGVQPSAIYNHVSSKQVLLRDIAQLTIKTLIEDAHAAVASTDDVAEQLRLAVCAHIKLHTNQRAEAHVANREIPSLEEPARSQQIALRNEYVDIFDQLIVHGVNEGRFKALAPRITAYAILQMGIGVSVWFHPDGPMSTEDVCDLYGELALRMVGAVGADA